MEKNTRSIVFSGTFLSINDKPINIADFEKHIPEDTYSIIESKRVHVYSYVYQDNYLKITCGDGSAMPRNPKVYDVETKQAIPNPRQPNHAETRETFGLIDFETGFLWLSDSRKRNFLLDFFRAKLDKNALIVSKDVYDEQLFIEVLKKLDYIKLSAVPDLFSQSGLLTEKLAEEINGYGAASAQLRFHYQSKIVEATLIEKIKGIFKYKNHLNGVVIAGRDCNNLGMLFNAEGFSRKIEFKALVDENEMFFPNEVFDLLITTIQNEKH